MELIALLLFLATIAFVIISHHEKSLIALLGVIVMIILSPSYTFVDAFRSVDWNVIVILLGMWMISGYLSKSGFPEYVVYLLSKRFRSYGPLVISIALLAGFITMFVDNVLVILLLGGLAAQIAMASKRDPLLPVMIIGLSANYMGTVLLLGDLPPQMLHSIAGAEFLDFIWFRGAPSSLPLLAISFIATLAIFYPLWLRSPRDRGHSIGGTMMRPPDIERISGWVSIAGFAIFMGLASIRPMLGVELGAIAISVAIMIATILETARLLGKQRIPAFEEILRDLEWRVILFYIALFMLVGGLKAGGVIHEVSKMISGYIGEELLLSYSMVYWLVAILSSVVEHDAIVLFMIKTLQELGTASGADPWPHYWATVWAGTLGSNATIAGAPALYLALVIAEKNRGKKASWREWMRITAPFTITSLAILYIISLPIIPSYIE